MSRRKIHFHIFFSFAHCKVVPTQLLALNINVYFNPYNSAGKFVKQGSRTASLGCLNKATLKQCDLKHKSALCHGPS